MTRPYKALRDLPQFDAKQGQVFDAAFTDSEEADHVRRGRVEIHPQEYKVVGSRNVHGADPGQTFRRALPAELERLLVESGQIEPAKPRKKDQE